MLFSFVLGAKPIDLSSEGAWKKMESYLVDAKGRRAKGLELESKDYILVYYSASWCPPCRKFTPELVKYYNKNASKYNFEVILMPSDRSDKAMEKYMKDYKMPWPGVKLKKVKDSNLAQFGGKFIPRLVLLDKKGKLLAEGENASFKKLEELQKDNGVTVR